MRLKSILRVSVSVGLILVMVSACSSSDSPTDSKNDITEGKVVWSNTESLEIPLKQAVSQSCPNFDAEKASLTFEEDYADFNLRLINLDDAKLLLYLDGAIEPEIEDEFSTVRFYEEWGCTEDTLYIQELRFSDGDFYSNENPISIFNCVDEYESQPSNLIITCADANMGVDNIVWKSWNNIEASGEGIFYENNCSPDCASGRIIRQKAEIQLSNIQRDKSGKSVFTEIIVQTKEKQQAGGYMDTYSLYFED